MDAAYVSELFVVTALAIEPVSDGRLVRARFVKKLLD